MTRVQFSTAAFAPMQKPVHLLTAREGHHIRSRHDLPGCDPLLYLSQLSTCGGLVRRARRVCSHTASSSTCGSGKRSIAASISVIDSLCGRQHTRMWSGLRGDSGLDSCILVCMAAARAAERAMVARCSLWLRDSDYPPCGGRRIAGFSRTTSRFCRHPDGFGA